ncbi:unnamed protein product [Auanema sp. JU1783]|nr:unnamed protein product [Auanema sp. JU1783]
MQEINELSFRRLKLVHDFVNCQQTLAQKLNLAAGDYCKAKSIHGFTLSSVVQPHEEMELIPSVRILVDKKTFRLKQEEDSDSSQVKKRNKSKKKTEEESEEKKSESEKETKEKKVGQYRPFGILEPTPAKSARKEMSEVMTTVCELASIRAEIKEVDNAMEKLMDSFKKDKELSALLSSMKVSN